jgi:hypothetical protein
MSLKKKKSSRKKKKFSFFFKTKKKIIQVKKMFSLRLFTQRQVVSTYSASSLLRRTPCLALLATTTPTNSASSNFVQFRFCSSAVSTQQQQNSVGGELATSNMNLAPQSTPTSTADTARATDVAKRVNATKRSHQTANPDERKRLERSAWTDLNTLSEEEIASADGQAVALLLNAWGYFSKFWERGKEGPLLG